MENRIEEISPDEVLAESTAEIARWRARIDRINEALRNNHKVMTGGMGDDGLIIWYLGERSLKDEKWQDHQTYEDAVLYELKPEVNHYSVLERPFIVDDDRRLSRKQRAAEHVGRVALRDGLARLGLLVPCEADEQLRVPAAAAGALYFNRASIEEPIDRKLYERKDAIRTATDALLAQVPVREMQGFALRPGGQKEPISYPVYVQAPYFTPEQSVQYGFDTESGLNPWWQELHSDLARIDAAASGNS